MIGAGIFALLGEAGAVAGAAVWISFLIAGIVAGLIGYVCVKLGVAYPTSGGLITYLIAGFGHGRLTGIAAWLGYMAAVVIVTAMVAVSFGGYATSLFIGDDAAAVGQRLHHRRGPGHGRRQPDRRAVRGPRPDRDRHLRVLAVFSVFIVVTITDINPDLLAFSDYPSFLEDHLECRTHVLRLPRLQRHHVRRGGPSRPDTQPSAGDVRGPGGLRPWSTC